jgi:competence protein ComEC
VTRHAPLVVPAALVVGLVVGSRDVPVVPSVLLAAVCLAAAWAAARHRRVGIALLALALGLGAAGAGWGSARTAATKPPLVRGTGPATMTLAIDAPPVPAARGARATGVVVPAGEMGGIPAGARVLVDLRPGARPVVGQVVRVHGRRGPAIRAGAPGWWRAWVRRQRISARVRATRWEAVGWRGGPVGARDALRRFAGAHVGAGLTGDRAALVRGMALGGGDGLSEPAARAMRDSGLWHLLAVSGQNVAVIGIGVMAALGAAGIARRRRLGLAGVAMLVYCLACDGGASVLRAGLMGAVGLAADMRGGRRAPWNAVLVALAVMLMLDPLAIGDPGLQLSFAAVVGLFAITPPVAQWLRGYMPGRVADLVAQSAGAGLATAPVLAAGFGAVSVVGLVSNLVAVPVAGPVVVVALAGVIGDALWHPLGVLMSVVAALGASVVMLTARMAAAIPGAMQAVPSWGAIPLVAVAVAPPLTWWWLRRPPLPPAHPRLRPRPALAACVAALVLGLAPVIRGCGAPDVARGPGLRMLDVGQGSAVALRTGRQVEVLVDAGPPGDPAPVAQALDRMDATGVGVLILSHGAADHAGGAVDLLARLRVGQVLLPEADRGSPALRRVAQLARARGVPVDWVGSGVQVSGGAWTAGIIGPVAPGAGADANARSLVVHARAPGMQALLPADAESPALRGLLLPVVDVLQVPHHGSADAGLPDVLARLRPSIALVSAGEGNPFGHPRAGTMRALDAAGARVVRTDRGGDIDVRATPAGMTVSRG